MVMLLHVIQNIRIGQTHDVPVTMFRISHLFSWHNVRNNRIECFHNCLKVIWYSTSINEVVTLRIPKIIWNDSLCLNWTIFLLLIQHTVLKSSIERKIYFIYSVVFKVSLEIGAMLFPWGTILQNLLNIIQSISVKYNLRFCYDNIDW